ncbi:MAG: two pore domain potassium channel family protein [Acidobacteriota bacterium]|nr:two pore domain potassium channel family protein [Acidobacteriota bacterium]
MQVLAAIAGLAILCAVLWDSFETIILPRRVTRGFRITRAYYRYAWLSWRAMTRRLREGRVRQALLSYFGPLSLLALFAIWVGALIVSFGLLHWAAGSAINTQGGAPSIGSDFYLSGTTFFTLGIGDVTPRSGVARLITVIESGTGFGILAIVISYLPVIYSAFSKREVNISLLDARAGSPPSAGELLRRHAPPERAGALIEYLRDWEEWSAELMESHLSYPALCFFRSQHSNQSWIAGLTTILDASAFLVAYARGTLQWQAQLTFAIARHAVVDLAVVVTAPPLPLAVERLPPDSRDSLRKSLAAEGLELRGAECDGDLAELRHSYESYLNGLSRRFLMPLPLWAPARATADNWQRSAWDSAGMRTGKRQSLRRALRSDD